MTLASPQALLLLVPIALVIWRFGLPRGPAGAWRVVVLLAAVVALAQPQLEAAGGGRDVLVAVDRSGSMPPGADTRAQELVEALEAARGAGDRVGLVTFGREARIERVPGEGGRFGGFRREISGDATDLGAALDRIDDLASASRETRVLVVSDGLDTSGAAGAAARRLAQRGIPSDFRLITRDGGAGDLAVERVDVPARVRTREPFQVSIVVRASGPLHSRWRLRRGKAVLAQGERDFPEGPTRLAFRDRLAEPGLAEYAFELVGAADALPENDRARGVVRVEGPVRIVVVREGGATSALAAALGGTGLEVEVTNDPPRSLEQLEGVGVVVLENVPASHLGEQSMQVLARFVRDAGGGLLMTGGRRSFGDGGYHRSPLDDVLPVSMELREEQRRTSIALGISLDRSGSMAATTAEGVTKMTLAAEGAVAALRLLSGEDEAAVWLVDTEPHELLPLTPVSSGLPLSRIASVRSEGGGIYVGVALEAAARALERSDRATRHLILFADASDSEEPANYRETLARLRAKGISVSVIGLGRKTDADAALLDEVARLGNGRIYYSERASELPRLFSEETIAIARSSFVEEPAAVAVAPDLARLGPADGRAPPRLGGHNVTYLRPRANVALRTADDEGSPVLAFWNAGLGRAAAFTGEADGRYTGEFAAWDGYRSLFVRTVRHLVPSQDPRGAFAKVRREGRALHVTIETEDPAGAGDARLTLVAADGSTVAQDVPLRREDAFTFGVRVPVGAEGTFFPIVALDGAAIRVPPVALAYPPEFEPREPGEGRATLEELAQVTGGRERLDVSGLFTDAGSAPGRRAVAEWLVWLALFALLVEVATRRLGLSWTATPVVAPLLRRLARARAPRPRPSPPPGPATAVVPDAPAPTPADPPFPPPAEPVTGGGMQSALDRARERARRRLE